MSNKKILLITLIGRNFNNNYGAVLQAFALQDFLLSNRFYVEILDYEPEIERASVFKKSLKVIREKSFGFFLLKIFQKIKVIGEEILLNSYNQVRNQKISAFKSSTILFTEKRYSGYDDLIRDSTELLKSFDIFLVGSDQVWNMWNGEKNLRAYLLGFVKNVKKISYASSVSSEIPETLANLYLKHLREFDYISVREEESAQELEKVLGYKPKVNIEPTLLLTKERWEVLAQPSNQTIEKPYVFVYDLYRSKDILPVVEKVSRKRGIKYVNYQPVFFLKKIRFPNLKFSYYTEGPREFLWLLKESSFVVTSSFHGVVFSIIFERPFYAILWDKKDRIKQNGRIINLLEKLGLRDRAFTDPKEILKRGLDENIDWRRIREKLKELREDSISWLLEALVGNLPSRAIKPKNNNVAIIGKQDCTGCFACYNICPVDAIEMILSDEGFYVPRINETACTNCGLCLEVCPVVTPPSLDDRFSAPKVYVAWSLDDVTRINSSSGGIYPELARFVLENDGVVFAVGWNKEWLPEHREVISFDEIPQTVGSKYVQSKVGDVYRKISDLVKSGKEVLFVGTPCQVAGLRNNMERKGISEDNVFTVDLVCHGVPSLAVFKKYLQETFRKGSITSYHFRSKVRGWNNLTIVVDSENGKYLKPFEKDSFGWGFLANMYLNLICYNCPFSQIPRQGDITLGDFWGVPEKYKDERGVSVVLVNSRKGEYLFNRLIEKRRIFAEQVPLDVATRSNPRIVSGRMDVPKVRETILKEIHSKSWRYISRKYIKPPTGFGGFVRRGLRFAKRVAKKIFGGKP